MRQEHLPAGKMWYNGIVRNVEVVGMRFGKWTVLRQWTAPGPYTMVSVRCDCGLEAERRKSAIVGGQSLGCNSCREPSTRFKQPRDLSDKSAFNYVISTYRRRSRKKNIPFEIDRQSFRDLTQKLCFYCDGAPSNTTKGAYKNSVSYVYNGLDRIDSSQGYVLGNVVPCCKYCNIMKSDLTHDEFFERINQLVAKWGSKPAIITCSAAKVFVEPVDSVVTTS